MTWSLYLERGEPSASGRVLLGVCLPTGMGETYTPEGYALSAYPLWLSKRLTFRPARQIESLTVMG